MSIAIYTLTSALHDEETVSKSTHEFLDSLHLDFEWKGADFIDYGKAPLNIIYVRTGGTEGLFLQLFDELRQRSHHPFYFLTSGKSNSLAASMEILSFLRQQGSEGEIIHGTSQYITHRIQLLDRVEKAYHSLSGCRLGIIGQPSDWLIASHADKQKVFEQLNIELVDVPMEELLTAIDRAPETLPINLKPQISHYKSQASNLKGAAQIYHALKTIVEKYHLAGFTLRCFDLLTSVHNTGCLALAMLNAEGIVAGCEGDVPAMLSMKVAQVITGTMGFQANPANINTVSGHIIFAHCTIPLNMVERFELDTHFESGIGVGIRGYVPPGPVTIFKLSGDLSRSFIAEGSLIECQDKPDLCRTQLLVQLADPSQTSYFFSHPIGNHHIILPGHHKDVLEQLCTKYIQ